MTSMTSQPVARLGSQTPRVSSVPTHATTAGDDAVELCAMAGLALDPWQQLVLRGALGEQPDGRWSAFEVGLVVGRQNGKSAILQARALAGLFLLGEQSILFTAHELRTAREQFRAIVGMIEATPSLLRKVKRVRNVNGQEAIELHNGQRLQFVARSKRSGRGFTADALILDEAMDLPPDALASLLPTLSSRPNPQIWYAASAGWPDSEVLRGVRERGIAGDDPRLAYYEWSAKEGADPDDRDAWADANPSLGIRIREDFIVGERAAMPDEEFARERLGVWDSPKGVAVINPHTWAQLADPESTAGDPVALSFDVSPSQEFGSVSWAGRREDGRWHVEVLECQPGDGWIVDLVAAKYEEWTVCDVVCDPRSPAGALLAELKERGVPVSAVSSAELGQACAGFFSAVRDDQLRHRAQPVLTTAVDGARKRNIGDAAWAWSRKNTSVDITPLVSVTLAQFAHARAIADGWTDQEEVEPWFAFSD